MPSLGADMEAGKLVEWLVKPGDEVKRGDVVAVVETQKGAIEIEIFEEGTIGELTADIGQTLPVGAPLAVVRAEGEAPPEAAAPAAAPEPAEVPEPAPAEAPEAASATAETVSPAPPAAKPGAAAPAPHGGGVAASPAARARARELGIDLSGVRGTGPGGVIVLGDLEGQARRQPAAPPSGPAPKPAARMEEMRKAIAAAMTRAKQTIPHFYLSETIDVHPATEFLAGLNAGRPPAERVLLGALFVRATAKAAAKVKTMNGHSPTVPSTPPTRSTPVSPSPCVAAVSSRPPSWTRCRSISTRRWRPCATSSPARGRGGSEARR